MLKKILLALIFVITAITNVTHAEDDMKTVASKAYVDTKIETKQLKIPAANTPGVGAGETVMTYTATGNGQIGERGLYSDISSYDATTDGDKLITASALNATFTNLPTTPTTKLECANQADGCTLWTIVDQTAYGDMLPSGYTRLQYIESTGTQYIDTGMASTNVNNVKAKISFTNLGTLNYILGTRPSSGATTALGYILYSSTHSGITMYPGGWPEQGKSDVVVNNVYDIEASLGVPNIVPNILQVDGIEFVSYNHPLPTGDKSIYIFALHSNNDSGEYFARARLYSMSLYNDSELVANYIPARKISDNAIGVYDTVSGQFFTNAATSGDDFTAGPSAN